MEFSGLMVAGLVEWVCAVRSLMNATMKSTSNTDGLNGDC